MAGKGGGSPDMPQELRDLYAQLGQNSGSQAQRSTQLYQQASPFFAPTLQQLYHNAGWVQDQAPTAGTAASNPASVAGWNGMGPTTEAQRWAYVNGLPQGTAAPAVQGWNGQGPTTEAQRLAYVADKPDLKAQWGKAGNLEAIEAAMKGELAKMPGAPQNDLKAQWGKAGNLEAIEAAMKADLANAPAGTAGSLGSPAQGHFAPINQQGWFQEAQQQAGQSFNDMANKLKYQANQMGTAKSPALMAGLANLGRGAQTDLGNFYRVQAPQVQNQRLLQAAGAAAPGIGGSVDWGQLSNSAGQGAGNIYNGGWANSVGQQQANSQLIGSGMGALAQVFPYL